MIDEKYNNKIGFKKGLKFIKKNAIWHASIVMRD